jgi:hypothetical protein
LSPELLPESSPEESALTSTHVDRFFLHVEEKTILSMAGIAGVRQLGPCACVRLPSPGRRRTWLFHEAPRKTHGGDALGRLLFVAAEPHSLGGAENSTEKNGRGHSRGASSLQNLPLESRAIPMTEMRLRWRRGWRKLVKGIEGGRRGKVFIKKVRMRKWYDD